MIYCTVVYARLLSILEITEKFMPEFENKQCNVLISKKISRHFDCIAIYYEFV